MFYRPKDGRGLPHNPFNAIVAPRPIGWISTRGTDLQDNLAPYSFFNACAYEPPQVMFCSTAAKTDRGDTKDSVAQIRDSGVFCVNIVEEAMQGAMNATSRAFPRDVDEFISAGIEKAECETISCPRVANAPASLECRLTQIIRLEGTANFAVFGEVMGVHMRDDCLNDGRFDVLRFAPLARMGYHDYTAIREKFELRRPDEAG